MKKKGYDKSVYRSFALIMQFGINMLVPICMMTALGIFLDKNLGTSFWMIVLFLLGAVAGGQNIYRMAKRIYDAPQEQSGVEPTKSRREQDGKDAGSQNIKENK